MPSSAEMRLERVVYTLTQNRKLIQNGEVILKKVDDFLGGVSYGEKRVLGQLQLSVISTRDIRSFRWG